MNPLPSLLFNEEFQVTGLGEYQETVWTCPYVVHEVHINGVRATNDDSSGFDSVIS